MHGEPVSPHTQTPKRAHLERAGYVPPFKPVIDAPDIGLVDDVPDRLSTAHDLRLISNLFVPHGILVALRNVFDCL